MAHSRKVSVVGLGYVGLPVAVALGKQSRVIGFDIHHERVAELQRGEDSTHEVDLDELKQAQIQFTSNPDDLRGADFHIIAVPTPVDEAKIPDLGAMISASDTVGKRLKRGDIVVFESTVYPGATEEDCAPVLEKASGLKCGTDFFLGYSPERINPGDREHSLERVIKIVSGQDARTLDIVAEVYGSVVKAGVYRAPSIRVAESAKVIENIQRDVNIALMNELSLVFHRLGIDTQDVLAAARTKWNFLPFSPGLVGGHCIGVDPYYLTHRAARSGYTAQVILSGRKINDEMGGFVASQVIKALIRQGSTVKGSTISVLGLTFKENVPDTRNTRVIDIVRELREYGVDVQVHDPLAHPAEVYEEYGIEILPLEKLTPADGVVLAVPHRAFVSQGWPLVSKLLKKPDRGLVADVRSALPREGRPEGIHLWRM